MRGGQRTHFAPYRTNLVRAAAVEAFALVEYHTAHRLFQHVVVEIALDERQLLGELLLGITGAEFGLYLFELFGTLLLAGCTRSHRVHLVVGLPDDELAQFLVVHFVAIGPLHILAELLHELYLHGALLLYLLVGEFDGLQHVGLAHLVHLALDHQDVVYRSTDHDVDIGTGVVAESGVDDELTVDTRYAHLRNGTAEGNIRYGERRRCGEARERIRLNVLRRRNQIHRHENLRMVIRRKERTEGPVDEPRYEYFAVRRTCLPFQEAARITAGCGVFLFIFHRKRHEIHVRLGVFGCDHGRQEHRIPLFDHNRTVGLLGKFSRRDGNLAVIPQRNDLRRLFVHHHIFYPPKMSYPIKAKAITV